MASDSTKMELGDDRYDVGGVLLERPFKIRRLGHFGVNVVNLGEAVDFYTRDFGYRIADNNFAHLRLPEDERATLGDGELRGFFLRYGTDHHAFVLFSKLVRDALAGPDAVPGVTVNQITWQVGSLREVAGAHDWFVAHGMPVQRVGRDMPGSNWHSYPVDPEGHVNELYYGIEQVGWDGYSKPTDLHERRFRERPDLPQPSEEEELESARARGVDLASGVRSLDVGVTGETYDVDGITLPRPFKIVRQGPVRLFIRDMEAALDYYVQRMGFRVTERVTYDGHTCVFLRCGTEHHSLALYPMPLRAVLGLSDHTSLLSFGMAVANYRQLKDAARFLVDRGVPVIDLPVELFPGMDHVVHVLDPDGHVLQLHHHLQQVAPDAEEGEVRSLIPVSGDPESWPSTIDARVDTYLGEPFFGPWG